MVWKRAMFKNRWYRLSNECNVFILHVYIISSISLTTGEISANSQLSVLKARQV
jgi:hypothetical protein